MCKQEYLLGTDKEELARLGFQHRVWAEYAFSQWERAGFGPGQTILDLGCGPGYASFDLASIVGPNGRVIAVDESERFLSYLDAQQRARGLAHIDTHRADAQQLDLPEGSIDGAYARWLICFVTHPEAVVAGVARALRDGGVFVVMDYFNYHALTLMPRSTALDRVVQAVNESWRRHGGDLDVMSRLPRMMVEHGLLVQDIRPIVRIAKPGSALWQWPSTFFRSYLPTLVEQRFLTAEERAEFEAEWEERSKDPTTFLCTPPMLDLICVKTGDGV